RVSSPKKHKLHKMCAVDLEDEMVIKRVKSCRAGKDNDFWFPMDVSSSEVSPPSSKGHSATFDPESKAVCVRWSERLEACFCDATVYKKELYVFGGVQPSRCPEGKVSSNALYIFNPEHGLWYQPIVEGDRPLPRFAHSTTLLLNKMIIFGGRKSATYLNDLHILDLGFMEYTAVKYENMPPLARGFLAALPVSDNRVLISGGCSAVGALKDLHLFNIGLLLILKPTIVHNNIRNPWTKLCRSELFLI
uniref:Zgc:163014 n=1 Tax=Sinocyclocheilus rhinocerous TaxID=307959 RepID=A0A673KGR8_9TELE